MSWTANPSGGGSGGGKYNCNLYKNIGKSKTVPSSDSCFAGVRNGPQPPKPSPPVRGDRPNIVFLVVESTDGRTWTPGYQNSVLELPNIRKLQDGGATFVRHYANAPVCCPSRATFWSGRHAHNIPHTHNGITVNGAWNNYEGLDPDYDQRIDQVVQKEAGYAVKISGKTDWSAGGHSLNVRLNSWTMYTQFPYNQSRDGGWIDETGDCASNGTVLQGGLAPAHKSAHSGDWRALNQTLPWIAKAAQNKDVPFFVYQGMNIVHPPYATNEYWFNKIDPDKIEVPEWPALDTLHPCDLQSSMLKRCTPSTQDAPAFYSKDRRRRIRRIYLAMVAEFDAMVGAYMGAVKEAGVWNNTVFIVTSDHGDMQLEHQQHYKMVPYDASASVPMVIRDNRPTHAVSSRTVHTPTQLIDIFPTIMDYAEVPEAKRPSGLDGSSLRSELAPQPSANGHADFVVSQFHGCNIAMSWFLIVQRVENTTYKYIIWGTGTEVPSLLFDLDADPSEWNNLVASPQHADIVKLLEANLKTVIDYPKVALDVASYNKDMFKWWINSTGPDWKSAIHASGLRWTPSWDADPTGAMEAVNQWMKEPARIQACRASTVWPIKP